MRATLAEVIVDFLSFSGNTSDHLKALRRFDYRDWQRTLRWLHISGLALYFLQKLRQTDATDIVPTPILLGLEQNLTANKARVAVMAHQFNSLNQRFDAVDVQYAVVKGFALVPQFCPDASLRRQGDCDYLVDDQSLAAATRVLEESGYALQVRSPRESVFKMPSARSPVNIDEQYSAHTTHGIELHLYLWNQDFYRVSMAEPRFSLANTQTNRWQGMSFQALPDEDSFLIQTFHAFHHILGCWIRMSWVYEMAYFLNRQAFDSLLWSRIERRVGDEPLQREIVVVVTALAAQFFGAPLPPIISTWAQELRPAVRVWVENYARKWAFGKNQPYEFSMFPTAKLALFLHREYVFDAETRRRLTWMRLLPAKQLLDRLRRSSRLRRNTSVAVRETTRRHPKKTLLRIAFHLTSGLRYLLEIPRWWWLNRIARLRHAAQPGSEATVSA